VIPPASVPPTLSKSFSPANINVGGVSTSTITLTNPNNSIATLSAALIDHLPSGLVIADIPNAGTSCGGGIVTAIPGGSKVTLNSGATIPANGSCTVTVNVTADCTGSFVNTLPVGALKTDRGNNAARARATLTVSATIPPKLAKSFSPATIKAGGVSTLTITLTNFSSAPALLTAPLTDSLTGGLVVALVPNASTTCVGGTVTAIAGGWKVTLTGGTIPGNGYCKVTVDVTAKYKGSYCNTLPAGALQTNAGKNVHPAVAILTVLSATSPPRLGKTFSPATIKPYGVSTLTITLTNTGSALASLTAPLTDYLPSGVAVAAVPYASTTCSGGTVTANAGGSKVILTGGAIPPNSSCKVTVNVTAKYNGSYCNTMPAGSLQTSAGKNAAQATATLTVKSTSW